MRRVSMMACAALFAGCGGELREVPLSGDYLRGAMHLYLWCPGESPEYRSQDLLYPLNLPGQTWRFEEDGHDVRVSWDGVRVAAGRRTTEGITLDFERLDPWSDPVDWHFEGRLRDDLVFHDRTVVGRVTSGTADGCLILPRSVAWFTVGERATPRTLDPEAHARAHGDWGRFIWFLDIGPYGMSRKGDEGQRGRNLRMFSFAATGGGFITTGNDAAFFDNGFGSNWMGAAENRAAVFDQPQQGWNLSYRQELLWDDDAGPGAEGIRRVLSGFVDGSYRVVEQNYPFGWEGETGMLPISNPGMAFWLDVVRVGDSAAGETAPGDAFAPTVITRETVDGAGGSPAIRIVDGVVVP